MYNYNFGYGNTMPTGTQPYGYPIGNYNVPQMAQPQIQPQTTTNKIYVSGIEEVRQKQLPNNSEVVFIDNDN